MIDKTDITGLVLAGGLGRRMSVDGVNTNKALRPFEGRPMVAHVIERLAPQVGPLLLNVNQEIAAFAAFELPIVSDQINGFAGPLAGLQSGLSAAKTAWVLTSPCDSPFLPLDLAERLASAVAGGGHDLAVARTGQQAHPVFALVATRVLDNLTQFLGAGGRKIDTWYASLSVISVDFVDESAFRNINTPEDLARLQRPSQGNRDE